MVAIERHADAIRRTAQRSDQEAKLIGIVVHNQYVRRLNFTIAHVLLVTIPTFTDYQLSPKRAGGALHPYFLFVFYIFLCFFAMSLACDCPAHTFRQACRPTF